MEVNSAGVRSLNFFKPGGGAQKIVRAHVSTLTLTLTFTHTPRVCGQVFADSK